MPGYCFTCEKCGTVKDLTCERSRKTFARLHKKVCVPIENVEQIARENTDVYLNLFTAGKVWKYVDEKNRLNFGRI